MVQTNSLVEYLYIDEARLNSYFEQISSPVSYDKVPIIKWVLSLMGPKTEATQARPGRPFTTHEKIARFKDYLEKHKLTISYRPREPFERELRDEVMSDSEKLKPFRVEQMTAQRGRLDPDNENKGIRGINVWVSEKPEEPSKKGHRQIGALFLIEDYSGGEGGPYLVSGYSSLLLLAHEMKAGLENTDLDIFHTARNVENEFGKDPIGTFSTLGARFGPPRRIQATYRVRACCNEMGAPGDATTTIGYPIIIQAL